MPFIYEPPSLSLHVTLGICRYGCPVTEGSSGTLCLKGRKFQSPRLRLGVSSRLPGPSAEGTVLVRSQGPLVLALSPLTSCFCRRPDDSRLMVQCDQCDGWFHGECIGVTTQEDADLDQYICPSFFRDDSQIRYLLISCSYSSDLETCNPTRGWANQRQRQEENIRRSREPPGETPRHPRGQGHPEEGGAGASRGG